MDYCNRKCPWCPNKNLNKTPDMLMKKKVFLKILSGLKKLNYRGSIHPYLMNEPLCDPRLKDWVRIIRKMFPRNDIMINTNGDLITDKKYLQDLIRAGLTTIVINLYDHNDDQPIQDTKHLNGARIKIRTLAYLKEREFWNRAGLINIPCNSKKGQSCNYVFQKVCINYLGNMILCCCDYRYEIIYGNIMRNSLMDIWNSEKYRHFRKMHAEGKARKLPLCKRCNRIK